MATTPRLSSTLPRTSTSSRPWVSSGSSTVIDLGAGTGVFATAAARIGSIGDRRRHLTGHERDAPTPSRRTGRRKPDRRRRRVFCPMTTSAARLTSCTPATPSINSPTSGRSWRSGTWPGSYGRVASSGSEIWCSTWPLRGSNRPSRPGRAERPTTRLRGTPPGEFDRTPPQRVQHLHLVAGADVAPDGLRDSRPGGDGFRSTPPTPAG